MEKEKSNSTYTYVQDIFDLLFVFAVIVLCARLYWTLRLIIMHGALFSLFLSPRFAITQFICFFFRCCSRLVAQSTLRLCCFVCCWLQIRKMQRA